MNSKMREALEVARRFVYASTQTTGRDLLVNDKSGKPYILTPQDALKKIDEVLSEPLRNCDVGTAEEQAERFDEFCYNHRSREKGCGDCPLLDCGPCELAWTQMPYGEGAQNEH